MKFFCVYDVKAENYLQPFVEASIPAALRGFDLAVNDGKSLFSRFPDDFCLMELGSFDKENGLLVPNLAPKNIGSARAVLKEPTQQNTLPFGQTQ